MLKNALLLFERSFTWLIVIAASVGLIAPGTFLWVKPFIPFLLGAVMFGIGLTIETQALKNLLRPLVLFLACGKFLVMPLLSLGIISLLQLPKEWMIGMVLLSACPGGVSANVMSYLSKAHTGLTVMLTILTTALSPIFTPLIIYVFLHQHVDIPLHAMMEKLFWIVLFPLLDAIIVRRFFMRYVSPIEWAFPSFSILSVALVIGFVAAANRETLLTHPWKVITAVLLFNVGGYLAGYMVAKLCRQPEEACKSVAFEYGMQDSSLGIMLATSFFSAVNALPSATCSLLQNITGPVLVRVFARFK